MKIRIENLPLQHIVYMRRTGAYGAENFVLMEKMKWWVQQNNLWNDDTVIYGIAHDNAATLPEECRYDVCLAVSNHFQAKIDVPKGEIPAGEYAVFTIEHTSEAVQKFWGAFTDEVEKLKRSFDTARNILECYNNEQVNAGYCEFCVPLKA